MDYRRKLDVYADVRTKRVNLFSLALWQIQTALDTSSFLSLEVDFAKECVWFW
jgi:hypothetical protein